MEGYTIKKENQFNLTPKGDYTATLMDCSEKRDRKGRIQVQMQMQLTAHDGTERKHSDFVLVPIQSLDEDGEPIVFEGSVVPAPKTWTFWHRIYRCFGVEIDKDEDGDAILNPSVLVGSEGAVKVFHDDWAPGKTSVKLNYLTP